MIGDMKLELKKARENKYAIPAVNTINPLMMKQYIHIADELQVPLIVSLAEAHLKYMALSEAFQMYEYYAKQTNIPIILHLDHGQDLSIVKQAIDLGFPSVMIDASEYNFNTNVRLTKEITNYAKGKNVAVEAEIGHVGASDNYETDIYTESIYTSTQEAIDFVEQTQPDSLAISVGTVHGHYKGTPRINFKRIKEIRNSLDIPLVLHGGSSSGDDNLKKAIQSGISKINIFTDIVTSINNHLNFSNNYFTTLEQINKAIIAQLSHYIKIFGTQRWEK